MKKRNKNIDKYRHERLSDPEIPADEAWAQMEKLLGPSVTPVEDPGMIKNLFAYKWILVFISAVTITFTIVFIRTIYQPLNEKSLDLKNNLNTKSVPVIKPDKNIEKIDDAAKPIKSASLEETPRKTSESSSFNENRKKTVVRTSDKVERRTTGVRSKTIDKSSRQEESSLSEVDPAARRLSSKTQDASYSTASTTRSGSMQRAGVLKGTKLQDNNRQLVSRNKSRESVIPESKSRYRRAEEFFVGPSTAESDKNAGTGSKISTVSLLVPISKIQKSYRPLHSRTIPEINRHPVSASAHKPGSSIQFGPEWSLNSSLKNTDYLFAGKDSVSKPALLLIPGIFIAKSWQQHKVSFTFSPYQSYFGNGRMVVHAADSTLVDDSLKIYNKFYNNKRLIKASGLNFSLYYHYQATKALALSAGASYSFFTNALVRKEYESDAGILVPGAIAGLNKPAGLSKNINPQLVALKTGVLLTPGHFQVGLNIIVPVSNISRDNRKPLKPLNGQLFIRFNMH